MTEKLINDLDTKIYITWKSRINASERYKRHDLLISSLNVYYAIILILVSIVSFSSSNASRLSIITTSTSILVFAFSMIGVSMQFKDRYYNFKSCYIKLDSLYKHYMSDTNARYDEVQKQYNSLLDTYENHNTIDYFSYLLKDKKMLEKKTSENSLKARHVYLYVYCYNILRIILICILVLIPFLVPYGIKAIEFWIDHIC